MFIPEQFTAEVDQNLDQAVAEGWAATRSTASTIAVTLGVLLARIETMGDPAMMQHVRRCVSAALAVVTCVARREVRLAERQQSVDAMYGSVPVEEFDAARADLARDRDTGIDNSFREDYEIGVWNDPAPELFISYKGRCAECGLSVEFKHTEAVPTDG